MNRPYGTVVMEDSPSELRKHLPILLRARGRVLVTGLGLGCVVRGLLAKPEVEHIDVVEIDRAIIARFAPDDPRVTVHHADALEWKGEGPWDFAWHDIHSDPGEANLQVLHAELLCRLWSRVGRQGAWEFPRFARRWGPGLLVG